MPSFFFSALPSLKLSLFANLFFGGVFFFRVGRMHLPLLVSYMGGATVLLPGFEVSDLRNFSTWPSPREGVGIPSFSLR